MNERWDIGLPSSQNSGMSISLIQANDKISLDWTLMNSSSFSWRDISGGEIILELNQNRINFVIDEEAASYHKVAELNLDPNQVNLIKVSFKNSEQKGFEIQPPPFPLNAEEFKKNDHLCFESRGVSTPILWAKRDSSFIEVTLDQSNYSTEIPNTGTWIPGFDFLQALYPELSLPAQLQNLGEQKKNVYFSKSSSVEVPISSELSILIRAQASSKWALTIQPCP